MRSIQILLIVLFLSNCVFSQCPKTNKNDSFDRVLSDSLQKYLVLGQNDVIVQFLIEIKPYSNNFITCLRCSNNEIQFLEVESIKNDFYCYNKRIKKRSRYIYRLKINSVNGIYVGSRIKKKV